MKQLRIAHKQRFNVMKRIVLIFGISIIAGSSFGAPGTEIGMESGGAWSPYVVGGLIGIVVLLGLYFSDKPVGASSFYATMAGFIGNILAPKHTMQLEYYKEKPPKIDWEFVFVIAAIFGSTLAAVLGGEFAIRGLPTMWSSHFGTDSWFKYAALSFSGGLLMAFGARLAGGCTSGHGISGTSQLSVSSWISVICFFVGGVIAVRFIY